MEFRELKQCMEKIEMSGEMQDRIIRNCRLSAAQKTEETTMKNSVRSNFKKVMSIAAVVALCLGVSAVAASHFGHFKDVKDWTGAVTGTVYVQATNEIKVDAAVDQDTLIITAALLAPDTVPYSELETFGIGSYQIVDESGDVVLEGESDEFVEIVDGEARMAVLLDGIESGDYKLLVSAFVGDKKADQPLKISGAWECGFTI